MVETGQFYQAVDPSAATHLALGWKGRTRYVIPRSDPHAQNACWKLFQPGRLELPLRAMARLPRLFVVPSCIEGEKLARIRQAIGHEAALSCCRSGAPGPWTKDTLLFLDRSAQPLLIAKAGAGQAVERLLRNEAEWLRNLRALPQMAGHLPTMLAYQTGPDLSFVAQTILPGQSSFQLAQPHFVFLQNFQQATRRTLRYQDSRLCLDLHARLEEMDGQLTDTWSVRLKNAMHRIEEQFSGEPIRMTAAHNDFTPWNIRIQGGVAGIFDWEYACHEQLPLFDPLHFVLMPMALKQAPAAKMMQTMSQTLQLCRDRLGPEECRAPQSQALAYLVNLCTVYLWSENGNSEASPVLESYARIIDSADFLG